MGASCVSWEQVWISMSFFIMSSWDHPLPYERWRGVMKRREGARSARVRDMMRAKSKERSERSMQRGAASGHTRTSSCGSAVPFQAQRRRARVRVWAKKWGESCVLLTFDM